MSRLEDIRKKWREHKQIVGQDVDFVLRFTELPQSMESARKAARDDLYMAIMFGPMKGIEDRLEATLDRVIAKIAAGVRAHDYETIDSGAMKPSSKIIGNGFTPDDFKDRDGQPASPEAAAHIANRRGVFVSDIYPLTVVADRYNGSYSGALWLAFNMEPAAIPAEVGGGDSEEMSFWHECKVIVGKGSSPYNAIMDLLQRRLNE